MIHMALALVESDHSAMRYRRREPMIAVMLGIKHIALIIAFPMVHPRADVWAEQKSCVGFIWLISSPSILTVL